MIEYKIRDGKIQIQKYKVVVYVYDGDDFEKDSYYEMILFAASDEDLEALKTAYINKHRRYVIHDIINIGQDDYMWMNGIEVSDSEINEVKFVNDIANMGEEGYKTSLVTTQEDYMADLDYRLSLIELGLV